MKTKTIPSLVVSFFLFALMSLSSCQDDAENTPAIDDAAKKEKVNKVLALREDLDFVSRFVDNNVPDIGSEEGRTSFAKSTIARLKDFAPCADALEEELPNGSIRITLNFDTGCETEEGVEVAGKVIMIFSFTENTLAYSLEFIDYSELSAGEHQGEVVNGTVAGSFLIDLEAGKFIQEMDQDLTITYPDNTEAGYHVAQKAELTEAGLRFVSFTTSGNFAEGGAFTSTATKALVYDFSCEGNLPVKGEEILTFQGNTIKVTYGDGNCDDEFGVN